MSDTPTVRTHAHRVTEASFIVGNEAAILGALEGRDREIEALRARVGWEVADKNEYADRLRGLAADLAPFGCRPTMDAVKVLDYARVAILELTRVRDERFMHERDEARKERDEARAALATARIDGARVMQEAAAVSLESAVWTADMNPYIPHTSLKGDIITGWSGPCEVLAHARFPVALPDAAHLAMLQGKSAWVSCFLSLDACAGEALPRRNVCLDRGQNFSFDPSRCRMRLDPRRPEVAHRIADVLRARGFEVGHLLPTSLGGRVGDVQANAPIPASCSFHGNARYVEPVPACLRCGGSGRVPFESDDFPPGTNACCCTCSGCRSETVTIPAADRSAVLLASCVAGVDSGRGVVLGVRAEWSEVLPGQWGRLAACGASDPICFALEEQNHGRGWRVGKEQGPETGPEGRACADAALLRLGFAFDDSTAPFGVRVPFLTAEGR